MPEQNRNTAAVLADVGRCHDESENENVLDTRTKMFVNCGAWHDGATDFALVSREDIVLCSWLPPTPGATQLDDYDARFRGSHKLIKFLRDANKLNRCFIKEREFSPGGVFKFTDDDELIVFMGDCHINLVKEWGPDGFIIHPSQSQIDEGRTRISLFPEFESFVTFANTQTEKENIIQIGDLYDVWEAQNIFEGAANVLRELVEQFAEGQAVIPDSVTSTSTSIASVLMPSATTAVNLKRVEQHQDYTPKFRHFYSTLFKDSDTFESCQQKSNADWPGIDSTPIALAKYFGIQLDNELFGGMTTAKNRDEREKLINHGFWKSKPKLQDVLALLFYGTGTYCQGFGRYAMPTKFESHAITGNATDIVWCQANCDLFVSQVKNLIGYERPVDFLNYSEMKAAIQRQYSNSVWTKFESIEGNHDMDVENRFLNIVFREGTMTRKQAKEHLGDPGSIPKTFWIDPEVTLANKKISHTCGKDGCILYEHGHAWDAYNNEKNYDLFDVTEFQPWMVKRLGFQADYFGIDLPQLHGGFHACRGWTVGDNLISGDLGYDGDFEDASFGTTPSCWEQGKYIANLKAIEVLEVGNHARAFAVYESCDDACKKIKLIVMGHSHNPIIVDKYKELENEDYRKWKNR